MNSNQGINRVIVLALICVCFKRISSNNSGYNGFVGCKFDSDVCQADELCVNDCLFGNCQTAEYYETHKQYCHDLTTEQLLAIQEQVVELKGSGSSWGDLKFQCIISNMLVSYRSHLPVDPSFCEDSSPFRQEIEDQISSAAERLLQKYLGGDSSRDYNPPQPPPASLVLSALQHRGQPPATESYSPVEDDTAYNYDDINQFQDGGLDYYSDIAGGPDSIDLTRYPYPLSSYEGYDKRATDRLPYQDSNDLIIPSRTLISRRRDGDDADILFPIDKKDEYVQVHKYLKSHKRDYPSYDLADYYGDYDNRGMEDAYVDGYDYDGGAMPPPSEEEVQRELLREGEGGYEASDEDFLNELSPEDIVQLYYYLTGKTLTLETTPSQLPLLYEDQGDIDSPEVDYEMEQVPETGMVPSGGMRKPIAEEMKFGDGTEEDDLDEDGMTPEDAKLLGDILQGNKEINNLTDEEVDRLSVYVDVLLRDLLGELIGEADGPQRLEEEEGDGRDIDADSQEKEAELEELFHDMGGGDGESLDDTIALAQKAGLVEAKRTDTQEGDQKDTSFDDATPNPLTTTNKFALVKSNRIWLKTKQKNLKRDEAIDVLAAIENILKAPKLLTQDNNDLIIGEGNITVSLDPDNLSPYNASYVAKIAESKKEEIANQSGIWIEDAGVGEGETIVSVTEIEHRSPKYFVVTFVLCGAVAGIVLAVIIIYIFRRHVISKEKLQQLSTALGIEDEASKDYQDLCRQRMQSKTSTSADRPEPVHVAASRSSAAAAAQEPRSTHSSRSSTSSWVKIRQVDNGEEEKGNNALQAF